MSDTKISSNSRHYSFAHNMQNVLRNQVNELALLNAINEAMSTDKSSISYIYEDSNGNQLVKELPSHATISTRVKALESTINRLQSGTGYITNNGVKTELVIKNVPETPAPITVVAQPTTFDIDSNWFFEQFMFPGAVVDIDLSGMVSQKTENVEVCRIILDSRNADAQALWTNELSSGGISYSNLISRLEASSVRYYEDRDTIRLPWTHNSYAGSFTIVDDPVKKNGVLWYHLDKLEYSSISEDGFVVGDNKILTPGDQLLYNNAVFSVTGIDAANKMISIEIVAGAAWPGVSGIFKYYQDPASSKHVKIRFGIDEYNFIYIRAVSHDYGIAADAWSNPVVFDSNTLSFVSNPAIKFKSFYDQNIADWGAEWVARAKEKPVSAYKGIIPNAPTLTASDFQIVQINNHRTAVFTDATFKQEYADLAKQQSEIQTLQNSLAASKNLSLTAQTVDVYANFSKDILSTQTALVQARAQYSSMADTLFSKWNIADESITPKYRVRGFFSEPAPVYLNKELGIVEEIIGYDIQYRYKTVVGNVVPAVKYTYVSADKSKIEAVFSDWNMVTSKLKTKVYNAASDSYAWEIETVTDGNTININQIDLPITQNESIEFRVRAISEAGYPENPLRSEWSNSVTISFDGSSAMISNSASSYINEAQKMTETINLQQVLEQEGLIRHVTDMFTVSGSTDTTYMHKAGNISYEEINDGYVTIVSLVDKIKSLETALTSLQAKYDLLVENSSGFTAKPATPTISIDPSLGNTLQIVSTDGIRYNVPVDKIATSLVEYTKQSQQITNDKVQTILKNTATNTPGMSSVSDLTALGTVTSTVKNTSLNN